MKNFLLFTISLLSILTAMAQTGTWKVKMNTKTILSASNEDEVKNKKTIKLTEWKKSGNLEVVFTELEKDIWFYRHILLFDNEDNPLFQKDSTNVVKIPLKTLRKLAAGKKEIHIYTTISPKDPNLAIRIRRVHLCTLRLP
jgi:hypothetical protein